MAEFVGGALLGAAVGELLAKLIDGVKNFKHRKERLLSLQGRLERLKPLVERLDFVETESSHPAGKWLRDLQQQLQQANDLVSTSRGDAKRMLGSGDFEKIHDRISKLLEESAIFQLGEHRELRRQVAQALTYAAPLREREIKRTICELDWATHSTSIGDGASSSLTTSTSPVKPHWSRACDIPDPPRVTFGDTAVADKLIENIRHGRYKKWIVMWGMGGIGKTFTASKVYHDASIKQHFTGGTFWVTVSKDQPPPHHILKLLYVKLGGEGKFPDDLEKAKTEVKSLLDKDRILLVLDDVWEPNVLEHLDVISEKRKGVILITTRELGSLNSVSEDEAHLKRIVDCAKIVEISQLSSEHSWQLFSWHAFEVFKKKVPPDLEPVARDVAQECKGLPLALQVIGSTMGRKHLFFSDVMLGLSLLREWEKALQQLQQVSHCKNDYEELYHRLQWSVDNLDDQDPRLKVCFFYMGAYPEDCHVPVKELVSIWAAEGLCEEEEGGSLLGFLVAKAVVELADGGRSCKIHDVMRDLVHRNLKFDPKHGTDVSRKKCLYAPGLSFSAFPDNWITLAAPLSVRRLSLQNNRLKKLPSQFNAPDLQVLMLGETFMPTLSPGFFRNLSNLRVLVLSCGTFKRVSGSVLRNLTSLVFLDLSRCSSLRTISDKLDRLQNLETILLHGCPGLWRLPQMKSLTKLHTLSVTLPVSTTERYFYRDSPLSVILRACISGNRMLVYNLRQVLQLGSLRRLSIFVEEGKPPAIHSLSTLEELHVDSSPRVPAGLMELHHLKVLRITQFIGNTISSSLNKLPSLEELSITGAYALRLPESFGLEGAFPSLRKLTLRGNRKELFQFHAGTMPKIEELSLDVDMREFPISVRVLGTLKCLWLYGRVEEAHLIALLMPDCFLSLEYLSVDRPVGEDESWTLPTPFLERETRGELKVEIKD